MTKILFFDVETTGLDYMNNGIHQLSGILQVNGKVVEKFDFKIKPAENLIIEVPALRVSGVTHEDLLSYPSEAEVYSKFIQMLSRHIDKFNKLDKAFLAGWNNAAFDNFFIRAFFERNNDQYFGSWFWSNTLDVMCLATQYLLKERTDLPNFKLMTAAAHILGGIEEDKLHDANYDIHLTREIYKYIVRVLCVRAGF